MNIRCIYIIICISCSSCNLFRNVSIDNEYQVECLGVELDGSQTLKVMGNGRNRFDAVEQAKKNAVHSTIFKGVNSGREGCYNQPLITNPNSRELNSQYFDDFFSDNGPYSNFVNYEDERISNKILRGFKFSRRSVSNILVVRVSRNKLKKKLMEDHLIQ